jgi:hypothetical protein
MQILIGSVIMFATWLGIEIFCNSYPATIEAVALMLKRHARRTREMHARRDAVLAQAWVKEMER